MSTCSCRSAWCLFWAGALLAFFFAFDYVLRFLFGFNRALDIQAEPRISEWIGFVLFMPLGFGIAFQLPLVMFFLNRIGLVSVKAYLEKWRIAILIIFVLSMILTPADPVSMLLMACPLSGLYFLGIAMATGCRGDATRSRRSTNRRRHQMASDPRSPVRMRRQSSSGSTKILPSPISPFSPVRAPLRMA